MKRNLPKLSFILSIALILQLLLPTVGAFAASVELNAPANVKIYTYNVNDIHLTWNTVTGATSYRVYKVDQDQRELLVETGKNTWYKEKFAEGTHTLAVSAVSGTNESMLSSPVTVQLVYPDVKSPTNLTHSIYNGNDLLLYWTKADYATSYNVYQVVDGKRQLITTTSKTSHYLSQLPEGDYVYEITTVSDRFGESKSASPLRITLVHPKIQPPAGLTSSILNGNDLLLSWQKAEYAKEYQIYRVVDGKKELVATTTKTSHYFSQLPEANYQYEVTTVSDRFGESNEASQISIPLVHPVIQSPTGLTHTIYNGNDLLIYWQKADYAKEYKVYQVVDEKRELVATTTKTNHYFTQLPEGEFVYEVTTVSDRFGESKEVSKIVIPLDYPEILPPSGLTNSIYNGNDVSLTWQKADYAKKYNIYRVANGKRELVASTAETNYYFSQLPEDDYVYEVTTVSERFGESQGSEQLSISVVFPEINAPLVALQMQDRDALLISWDKVDFANFYNVYKIVEGEVVFLAKTNSNAYSGMGLADGTHEYVVTTVSNRFGESLYSNKVVAEVKPKLLAPPASPPAVNGDDVTLSWGPVEGAGSYNIYEEIDGEKVLVGNTKDTTITIPNLEAGDHEFIIVPVAESGVEGDKFTTVPVTTEEADVTPPVTSSNAEDKWLNESFIVKLTATDDRSGVEKTYYSLNGAEYVRGATVFVSDPGVNTVSFFSVDKAGNIEEVKTVQVKIDTTAPVTIANVNDQAVELTATDDLSGVAQTFYSVNGSEFEEGTSFVVSKAGLNKVSFYSVDNAGNIEETQSIEVNTDTNAPETVSNVTDQWYQDEVSVELTATDDVSGVAKTYYSINGSEFVEGTTFAVTEPGTTEVSFYSVDNAGNVEKVKTAQVKIDTKAPETTSNVSDQWYQGEAAVELTATDDVSGVAKTYYSINGSEYVEGTTFAVTEPGTTVVSFYSVDNAGNVEEVKTAQVKIDTKAPETTSNVSDQWYQGEAAVELTATDDVSGVANTYYSINGSEFVEGTTFAVTEPGTTEISFYSVDNAGNVEEVKIAQVKIDTKASETTSNVSERWYQGEAAVELTATDDLSGVATTYYSVNGSEFKQGTSFVVSKEGVNKVSFYSLDNAGNVEVQKTVEVKIDKTAPTISIPLESEQALGSTFTLDYVAADNLSGIAAETVTLNGKVYKKGDKIALDKPGSYKLIVTVTDAAGWSTQVEKEFLVYIPVTLEVLPKVIKGNKGVFTVKATLPKGYESISFDVPTVKLNGVSADPKNNGLQKQAEKGHFKFEREDFVWQKGEVVLELHGQLENGYLFIGKTTVEVK